MKSHGGPIIDLETLRSSLSYNQETGRFYRKRMVMGYKKSLSDPVDFQKDQSVAYRRVHIGNRLYAAHRLAWFYVYGEWPRTQLDHINGDPSDNRISNLRLATPAQNSANRKKHTNNTSGFTGVYKLIRKNGRVKYRAYIAYKNWRKILLETNCIAAAHLAYIVAASKLHGEFMRPK